jgi:hypothetical protein
MRTGSLRRSSPGCSVTDGCPSNVSCRLVPGTIVAPLCWRAAVTGPKVTGWVPNLLLSFTRHTSPPMLGCTTMRRVWSSACSSGKAYSSSGCSTPGATSPSGPGCPTVYPSG